MALEGHAEIFGKAWGRAFRAKGAAVDAHLADSIQYHTEAKVSPRFQALLKRSGFNHVYLIPKTVAGDLDPAWSVIWLPQSLTQLELLAANTPGAAGLIKGAKSLGLRIETTQFAAAWKRLKPDVELPDMRQFAHTYRLHPLPIGLDGAILKQWAASLKWDIKPLRSTGAKRWLVASDQPPPPLLVFNSQPILAQQMPTRGQKPAQSLIAGPRLATAASPAKTASSGASIFKVGDPFMDPWSKSKETPSREQKQDNPAAAPQEPRALTGPVEDRLTQQDARLAAMESTLHKMEQQQLEAQQTNETKIAALEHSCQAQAQVTQQTIDQIHRDHQSLSTSIAQAFSQQDTRLASALDELKSLYLAGRGTKRHDPEAQSDEDLESDS